jgi:MFS superfamily sulfate permease-like transporter
MGKGRPIIRFILRDMFTGFGLAGLMLPEAVAYAGIAGLPPGRALAAGVAGGVAYALVGRSRFAVVAPTSSSAAILAAALVGLAGAGITDPAQAAAATTLLVALVGVMFLGLAAFRLGSLSGFISRPVLRGFALGLAITIIARQMPKLFGVSVASGPVWQVLRDLAWAAPHWNLPSLLLGIAALSALIALRRVPHWPGALMVIVAGLALAMTFDPVAWGVALAGPVALSWPDLALPPLDLLPRLAQLAAPIALILYAESWGTMRTLALRAGDTLDPNRELGALGWANLASALAQGMPVGAGFSAGNANAAAGAQSRLAALVGAVALGALALWAAPLIARLPEPVLAAVVIAALTHALSPAPILRLIRLRRDHWVAIAAALGVLGLGVLSGMLAAIALSIATLLYDLAHPSISELGRVGTGHDFIDIARHGEACPLPGVAIYRPNAPLIFANAESVLAAITARAMASAAPVIVLSLEESNDIDTTALDALSEFVAARAQAGQRVVLARAHDRLRDMLVAAGMSSLAQGSTYSVADAVIEAGAGWQDSIL